MLLLPTVDELTRAIRHAVRAPSLLNTQPWRFVVTPGRVELHADRSRQVPAIDPDGREMVLSCGAALHELRIAARHAGWAPLVTAFPDADSPDHLATTTFEPAPAPSDDRPYRALSARRTHRSAFADEPVADDVVATLEAAAAAEGARFVAFRDSADRVALADLVAEGVRRQAMDPAAEAAIRSWLRAPGDPRPDGIRDPDQAEGDRLAVVWTAPAEVAASKRERTARAPIVAVLATAADGPRHWLAAGQALDAVLLAGTDRGLAAAYANEPVEVAALRPRVAALVGGAPQMLMRMGYPAGRLRSPRRYPSDVIAYRAAA